MYIHSMKMNSLVKTGVPEQDGEDKGIRELLASLPQTELAGLLKTVTSSLVKFGSVPLDENGKPTADAVSHAVTSIIMYAGNATSVLDRSRMKKDLLIDYLNRKGVKMTIPATKNSLCKDVLRYWGQVVPNDLRVIEDEERATTGIRSGRANENQRISSNSNQECLLATTTGSSSSITFSGTVGDDAVALAQAQELDRIEYEHSVSLRQRQVNLGQQLGKEFAAWYYERLNTLTDFTTSHFWPECNFRLEIIFAAEPENTVIDEIIGNAEAACAKIKDLVVVKGLLFNPEASDAGVRGYINPHGLAQVMVCGGIFQRDRHPVGVFEQMFGLMKDPRDGNNYKIKFSVLRLREGGFLAVQSGAHELCDSSLVGIVEEIDDD